MTAMPEREFVRFHAPPDMAKPLLLRLVEAELRGMITDLRVYAATKAVRRDKDGAVESPPNVDAP